jgi:hypothetical protein
MQHDSKTTSRGNQIHHLQSREYLKRFVSLSHFFIWSWKYSAYVEMSGKQRKKMSQVSVSIISSGKYLTQPRQVHGNIYIS